MFPEAVKKYVSQDFYSNNERSALFYRKNLMMKKYR